MYGDELSESNLDVDSSASAGRVVHEVAHGHPSLAPGRTGDPRVATATNCNTSSFRMLSKTAHERHRDGGRAAGHGLGVEEGHVVDLLCGPRRHHPKMWQAQDMCSIKCQQKPCHIINETIRSSMMD